MLQAQASKFFDFENIAVYLIPMDWVKKWMKFCDLKSEDNELEEEEEEEGNNFNGGDNLKYYPGAIYIDSLIEKRENLLLDPRPEYQHTNFVLKKGMRE